MYLWDEKRRLRFLVDFEGKVLLHPPTITTDTAESMKRNIIKNFIYNK